MKQDSKCCVLEKSIDALRLLEVYDHFMYDNIKSIKWEAGEEKEESVKVLRISWFGVTLSYLFLISLILVAFSKLMMNLEYCSEVTRQSCLETRSSSFANCGSRIDDQGLSFKRLSIYFLAVL